MAFRDTAARCLTKYWFSNTEVGSDNCDKQSKTAANLRLPDQSNEQ